MLHSLHSSNLVIFSKGDNQLLFDEIEDGTIEPVKSVPNVSKAMPKLNNAMNTLQNDHIYTYIYKL